MGSADGAADLVQDLADVPDGGVVAAPTSNTTFTPFRLLWRRIRDANLHRMAATNPAAAQVRR
ncbi:hypothetical protein ACFYP0_14450 [Micromonospora arida]|uniref:hypothetical protein n=1 Tax=Micromonospora TaxID=1873 RepID=UPI00368CBB50